MGGGSVSDGRWQMADGRCEMADVRCQMTVKNGARVKAKAKAYSERAKGQSDVRFQMTVDR